MCGLGTLEIVPGDCYIVVRFPAPERDSDTLKYAFVMWPYIGVRILIH